MISDPKIEKQKENYDFYENQLAILLKSRQRGMPTIFKSLSNPKKFDLDKAHAQEELKSQNWEYDKLIELIVDQSFRIEALEHELALFRDLVQEKDRHAHSSNAIEKKLTAAGANKRASGYEADNKTYEEVFHSMCLEDGKMPTFEAYHSKLEQTPRKTKKRTVDSANSGCVWSETTARRKLAKLKKEGHL